MRIFPPRLLGFLAAIGLVLPWLAGCGNESPRNAAPQAPREHLVEVTAAPLGNLSYSADRAGSLRALREVRIVNQEEGQILTVTVREGDRVKAGRVLVRYDDRILRAQLDKANATLRQTEADYERNRQLIEKGFVGADALSRAATARDVARAEARLLETRLQHLTLAAPFDGVIAQRRVEPGTVTPRHTHLLTLIDPSRLITDVDVSELVLPYLRVGDAAGVRIDALGETTYEGKIVRIHPAIDPVTRAGRVEVALDPVPPGARPGHFCRVVLSTGSRAQVLVPLAAVRRDEQGEFVFVYEDDVKGDARNDAKSPPAGTVRRAGVTTGLRLADQVEIRSGIEPGARVVTKGFIGLAPGVRVRLVDSPGG